MNKCPKCGFIDPKRSNDISTHFHAHVTQIARESGIPRDNVYTLCLLLAVENGACDGGKDYPYVIINDVLYPKSTTMCSNKQVMTAVEATHMYASQNGINLNERWMEE